LDFAGAHPVKGNIVVFLPLSVQSQNLLLIFSQAIEGLCGNFFQLFVLLLSFKAVFAIGRFVYSNFNLLPNIVYQEVLRISLIGRLLKFSELHQGFRISNLSSNYDVLPLLLIGRDLLSELGGSQHRIGSDGDE